MLFFTAMLNVAGVSGPTGSSRGSGKLVHTKYTARTVRLYRNTSAHEHLFEGGGGADDVCTLEPSPVRPAST